MTDVDSSVAFEALFFAGERKHVLAFDSGKGKPVNPDFLAQLHVFKTANELEDTLTAICTVCCFKQAVLFS